MAPASISEIRPLRRLAALAFAVLALAACSPGGGATKSAQDPKFAGLDTQILAWRADIEKSNPLCAAKVKGKGCEAFEVACKAERTITPEEQARGVTAKLVSAMTFAATTPDGAGGKPGSAFAEFSKAGDTWTRTETAPVNLSSCAGF
jgi:hypothetical protein